MNLKKVFYMAILLIALLTVMGCPPPGGKDEIKYATGADGNTLASTVGPVDLILDSNITKDPPETRSGAIATVETFDGLQAVRVTKNSSNEIRFVFKLQTPVVLTRYGTLSLKIGGVELWNGYNIEILYDEVSGADRVGSFYQGGNSNVTTWTTLTRDLTGDEIWGTNFNQTRLIYGIQFYTDVPTAQQVYITDLALTPYPPGYTTYSDMVLPTDALAGAFSTSYIKTVEGIPQTIPVTGTISTVVNTGSVSIINGNEIICSGAGSYVVYTLDTAMELSFFINLKFDYLNSTTDTYEGVIALRDGSGTDIKFTYGNGHWTGGSPSPNTTWATWGSLAIEATVTPVKTIVFGLADWATMASAGYRNIRFTNKQ